MNAPPQQIGIAVVEQGGGYLIGVRGDDGPLPGLHEFPGGKCRPQEPAAACAVRECFEETGLSVTAVEELARVAHRYPHRDVELHFWLCRPLEERDVRNSHDGYRWIAAAELPTLNLPDANAAVVELLRQRHS